MEILIVVAILTIITKRGVEDIIHTVKGGTPPRRAASRERRASGAAGRYWGQLWDDTWEDLSQRHSERRAKRATAPAPAVDAPRSPARIFVGNTWRDGTRGVRRSWDGAWERAEARRQDRATRPRPGQVTVPGTVVPNVEDGEEVRPEDGPTSDLPSRPEDRDEDGRTVPEKFAPFVSTGDGTDLTFGDDPTDPTVCPKCGTVLAADATFEDGDPYTARVGLSCPTCDYRAARIWNLTEADKRLVHDSEQPITIPFHRLRPDPEPAPASTGFEQYLQHRDDRTDCRNCAGRGVISHCFDDRCLAADGPMDAWLVTLPNGNAVVTHDPSTYTAAGYPTQPVRGLPRPGGFNVTDYPTPEQRSDMTEDERQWSAYDKFIAETDATSAKYAHLHQEGPSIMTATTTEVSGLDTALQFSDQAAQQYRAQAVSTEAVGARCTQNAQAYRQQAVATEAARAALAAGGVTGVAAARLSSAMENSIAAASDMEAATALLAQAQEKTDAAGADMEAVAGELKRHLGIQEQYDANPGAGTRDFITANR